MKTLHSIACAALSALMLHAGGAAADKWPDRPVTIVVPYSAGGGVDPVARLVAEKLTQRLGQAFIVENKPGASGMIGTTFVARARPDGYTLLMSASDVIAINPHLYKNMTYDPRVDLAPITEVVSLPFLLVTASSFPAHTLKDLVDMAKKTPGKYAFASGGTGSLQHLAAEMLMSTTGINLIHVPYKGVVPAMNDLLGGQVPVLFAGFPTAIQHVRTGKIHALGVTSAKRMEQAKDIPTIAEQGYPGFEVTQWFGFFAPAKTPPEIVERLYHETAAVLASPDMRERLVAQGADPVGSSPAEFKAFTAKESAKFGKIVQDAHVKID
ncbi:MAG TPA: tripartite tricarboxylate transporter substrate binding protein [Usitatibacter sp.]|jgi:tripartite-type tricarboxylate transporter receptor subunit TctC|nr:tripartite tricarboxylate transporter substrate binding protein [Usitatibacter sp.]